MKRAITLLLCSMAAATSGCIHSSTEEWSLGGVVTLEAISPAEDLESELEFEHYDVFDRSAWPQEVVLAPNDQTTELPRFVSDVQHGKNTPRQRAEYPTALSAVDRDLSEKGRILDAIAQPFWAGLDVILIPFRTKHPTVLWYERSRETIEGADSISASSGQGS